jgi:hypothetical protein
MDKQSVEPTTYDDIIFENSDFIVKKTSFWPGCFSLDDDTPGLLRVDLPDNSVSKEELRGIIEKAGKEIRPFNCYYSFGKNDGRYLQAPCSDGKWGIINVAGEWVVEPIFAKIDDYISKGGCFAFYATDKLSYDDDVSMGIYSINEHRVLFEPHFVNVNFIGDGIYQVEVYDEKLKQNIEQTIDRTETPIFYSVWGCAALCAQAGTGTLPIQFERVAIYNDLIIATGSDGSIRYDILRKPSKNDFLCC